MKFLRTTIYYGANVNPRDFHVKSDLLYDLEKVYYEDLESNISTNTSWKNQKP